MTPHLTLWYFESEMDFLLVARSQRSWRLRPPKGFGGFGGEGGAPGFSGFLQRCSVMMTFFPESDGELRSL